MADVNHARKAVSGMNGNGHLPVIHEQNGVISFLKEHAWALIVAMIAGGWILTPATKSSVDALSSKFDTYVKQQEKAGEKLDAKLDGLETLATEMRVWMARVEGKISTPHAVAPKRKALRRSNGIF